MARSGRGDAPTVSDMPLTLVCCTYWRLAPSPRVPTVRIGGEHFGDGSMHQLAPVSAALHLGARRVLVIGVGSASPGERAVSDSGVWPSPAQIAGHMLDAIFIDTLDMDLERLQRVNQTLAHVRQDSGWFSTPELKVIETLVIRPTERMDAIAASHAQELPRAMRFIARRIGVLDPNGAGVLSYLLFERGYCRDLMNLGFSDGMARRVEILNFWATRTSSIEGHTLRSGAGKTKTTLVTCATPY